MEHTKRMNSGNNIIKKTKRRKICKKENIIRRKNLSSNLENEDIYITFGKNISDENKDIGDKDDKRELKRAIALQKQRLRMNKLRRERKSILKNKNEKNYKVDSVFQLNSVYIDKKVAQQIRMRKLRDERNKERDEKSGFVGCGKVENISIELEAQRIRMKNLREHRQNQKTSKKFRAPKDTCKHNEFDFSLNQSNGTKE